MSGFCGQCGTPRVEGARFCMTCGAEFKEPRLWPTCGQKWPTGSAPSPEVSSVQVPTAPAAPVRAAQGIYSTQQGTVFFDGTRAWVAVDRGGFFLPDKNQEVTGFVHNAAGTTLVLEQQEDAVDRPNGPLLGPDYLPGRDCGNCGFELSGDPDKCDRCGSTNTGAAFDPSMSS